MASKRVYFIIRCVATDEIKISPAVNGYVPPPPDFEFTWSGPFKSRRGAIGALQSKQQSVYEDLYPDIKLHAAGTTIPGAMMPLG